MAEKCFTLSEVMEELQGSDFEDSDDDFEGYLDMDAERDESVREEQQDSVAGVTGESVAEDVGAYVEVSDSDTELNEELDRVPEYTQVAGCSASVGGDSPLDFFSAHH